MTLVNPYLISRRKNFFSKLAAHHLDGYLITSDINIRYLTGFPASESWLLVSPKKSYYMTDFRYVLEARQGLPGIAVHRYRSSLSKAFGSLARALRLERIGFDDRHLSFHAFKRLKNERPASIKLIAVNGLVEELREIKDAGEINLIRQALKLHLEAYRFLKGVIKPGVRESEVLLQLERFVRDRKVGFAFDPIIASGPNSCLPHAKITDRKIQPHEPVLVDIGIEVDGYKSDLTRIFFLGTIPHLVRKIYSAVALAQEKAITKIQPGVRVADIDAQARRYLNSQKLGQFFGHSLGHGVGLEIHEGPRLSSQSSSILKENMVVTVEPAVYLPQKFGIRIEDMVLVTAGGCEVLSGNRNHRD